MDIAVLKQIRRIKKVKIQDLAKKTGLNVRTISLIENGKANPRIDTLEKIAEALDCKIVIAIG